MMKRLGVTLAALLAPLFVSSFAVTAVADAAGRPRLWLEVPPSADYMNLFKDEEAWPKALGRLDVFVLQTTFASQAGDPTLKKIFAFLDSHNIALGLEAPIQTPGPGNCGLGIEGYRQDGVIKALMEKFRRLGAHLQYVTLDEPLWMGHFNTEKKPDGSFACEASIREVAENVARNVAVVRESYPDARIGEDEPIVNAFRKTHVPGDFWAQTGQWLTEYQRATGKPLAFEVFDIGWFPAENQDIDSNNAANWPVQLQTGLRLLKARGIASGIFYNGNPQDSTGEAWTGHAAERFLQVESRLHLKFDNIFFATWMKQPKRLLPESSPDAMTNLISRYVDFEAGR